MRQQLGTAGVVRPQLIGEPIAPVLGESLRSIVAETCFENGLPNSFGLLGPLGLQHRNKVRVAEGADIDPADLAYAMNLPQEEVTSRRYEALELGYIDFFGLQINKMRVTNTVRRFAPAALKISGHHRAVWELRDIPFCLETWDMLGDTCPCPTEINLTVQRWTRTGSRVSECDRCGQPLSELPSQFVPEPLRNDLIFMRELLMPEIDNRDLSAALPEQIANTDRGRIFDCLRLMSEISKGGLIAGLDDFFADKVLRWHRACKALSNWPNAFPGDWISANTSATAYAYRRDIYLDLSNEPEMTLVDFKKRTGSRGALVRRQVRRPRKTAEERAATKRIRREKERNQRRMRNAALKIGLRPASEAAKLDPKTLLRAQEEGLLGKFERRHGKRKLPAFDRDEAIEFGRRWNTRIPVSKVAFDFEISHHGVEQLAAMSLLDASAPRFEGEGPHFTQHDITAFRRKFDVSRKELVASSTAKVDEWITLHDAMRFIDDRPKPWGPALRMMLEGDIAHRVPTNFKGSLPTLEVRCSDLATICDLRFETREHPEVNFAPTMVQRDVCEIFNLKESKADAIAFLPSSGTLPKRYASDQIEAERAMLLSHSELARRLSTTWRHVRDQLLSAQVNCTVSNYYDREMALSALVAAKRH